MTRKMTFKTLFAAVFLLAGTSGSWAAAGDVTTNVDIDFSNAITDGVVTGTKGSMTIGTNSSYPTSINSDGHLQLGKADNVVDIDAAEYAGTKDVVTVSFDIAFGNLTKGYTSFYLYDKDNAEIAGLSACTYDSKLTSSIGLTSSTQIQYAGKKATPAEWIGRMHFVISLDYATKTITTEATKYTNGSAGTASTYTATMTNTNSIASFKIGTNYTTRWSQFDNLKIETTAGNYDVESASYTVKYVCGDAEVKTSSIRTADVGTTPELTASDMSNIFDVDGVKYMYVSNDAAEKTVASDGTTVVTVTLRRAETWNYTIVDDAGKTLKSGAGYEQETLSVPYPAYELRDGELYSTSANNKEYNTSIILTEDNVSKVLTYASAGVSNVVFLQEAENITGMTLCDNSNTAIRSSNSSSAYAADGDVTITNLPSGKYKINSVACDAAGKNASAEFSYQAGDHIVFTHTCTAINWDSKTSDEFLLNYDTDIKLMQGGNSKKGIDLIYIQKTGDADASISKTISAATYATLYNENALDFSTVSGLTAYIGTVTGNTATFTKVASVPAFTPVLLQGEAGDYTIPTATTVPATVESNALIGVSVDTQISATTDANTNYVLMAGTPVGFYKVGDAGFTVGAGTAYLSAATASGAAYFALGDITTAIQEVNTGAKIATGTMYNLNGQRIIAPQKGQLYIQNNRKRMK